MPVFKAITGDLEEIGDINDLPLIPAARVRLIREKFNAVDQLREAAHYYALYSYNASWKELCVSLYRARETAALQIARSHLQTVRGTCTMFQCSCTCSFINVHVIIFMFT